MAYRNGAFFTVPADSTQDFEEGREITAIGPNGLNEGDRLRWQQGHGKEGDAKVTRIENRDRRLYAFVKVD